MEKSFFFFYMKNMWIKFQLILTKLSVPLENLVPFFPNLRIFHEEKRVKKPSSESTRL